MAACGVFRSHRFKDYATNQPTETCVRCGKVHADVARKIPAQTERPVIRMREAHRQAVRLLGVWAMVSHDASGWKVGKFLRAPWVGSPPWPWEVWGQGATFEDAMAEARKQVAK